MNSAPHNKDGRSGAEDRRLDPPADIDGVLAEEWAQIRMRRRFLDALRVYIATRGGHRSGAGDRGGAGPRHPLRGSDELPGISVPPDLMGLGLSGGGIRSATFCLGVVQELRACGLLSSFDYLSTVSGGGYLGGWWSGWLSREPFFVPAELLDPVGLLQELFPDENSIYPSTHPVLEKMPSTETLRLRELAKGRPVGVMERQLLVEYLNRLLEQGTLYAQFSEFASEGLETFAAALRVIHDDMHDIRDEEDQAQEHFAWERCEQVLLNRFFLEELFPGYFDPLGDIHAISFPREEGIEPDRYEAFGSEQQGDEPCGGPGAAGPKEPVRPAWPDMQPRGRRDDDSSNAWFDPIHHLRLFANYLTPRKGSLSADTWRAIAAISRNLVLTWLVLVPIFVAVMLCGQLYFLWHPDTTGDFLPPRDTIAVSATTMPADSTGEPLSPAMAATKGLTAAGVKGAAVPAAKRSRHEVSSSDVLLARLAAAAVPIVPILGWIVVVVTVWIIYGHDTSTVREKMMPWVELGVAMMLVIFLFWSFTADGLALPGTEQPSAALAILSWWWSSWPPLLFWALVAVGLVVFGLRTSGSAGKYPEARNPRIAGQLKREVCRNQLVRIHSTLLVVAVGIAIVLLFAGFGHELVNYLFYSADTKSTVSDYLKEIGGWSGLVLTLGGTIYTLMKASPAGGGDTGNAGVASRWGGIILGITPPLLILFLALLSAWWGHGVVSGLVPDANGVSEFIIRNRPFHYITFVGIFLCFIFTWYEMTFIKGNWPAVWVFGDTVPKRYIGHVLLAVALVLLALLVSNGVWSIYTGTFYDSLTGDPDRLFWEWYEGLLPYVLLGAHPAPRFLSLAMAMLAGGALLVRLLFHRVPRAECGGANRFVWARRPSNALSAPAYRTAWELAGLTVVVVLILAVVSFALIPLATSWEAGVAVLDWLRMDATRNLTAYVLFGFCFCLIFLMVELFFGDGANYRSIGLLCGIFLTLVVLLRFSYIPWNGDGVTTGGTTKLWLYRVHAAFGLITTLLTWAIAIGWTVNPNMVSLHGFYKARLTRAYLGASNRRRRGSGMRITEAVVGDDLPLAELRNCRRGGPYHLVNTTLNLVGGRDLSTAQRSAANFILTQNYCGSLRTGYRPTQHYMRGGMTLGTAVSISGAAASPNMGSKTPTAALAMLMTFFNVRLGYWAPTPNADGWEFGQARLWPFYTLREFLSQTHDLSSFCYLTDGGHFDNTGLYALIERGCRYILVIDCGADPQPCFSDLGEAIRRCRIDFGAEFELDLDPIVSAGSDGVCAARSHYVAGTVTYSAAHLRRLHGVDMASARAIDPVGYIIVVKPMRVGNETVDVRQYGFQNGAFPQQTTADQWFDESQFESYRKLGERSIRQLIRETSQTSTALRVPPKPPMRRVEDAADAIGRLGRTYLPTAADLRLIFKGVQAGLKARQG